MTDSLSKHISEQSAEQVDTDQKNAEFWDTLCGTQLAEMLGIRDDSPESLKKFDDWYMAFYPYLYDHIPFERMRGKKVMDVGLGYGTVAQKLAEAGADYHGLDIAAAPVGMAKLRLSRQGLPGDAVQGNVLAAPFEDNYFDWAIAIGCLHHTGSLKRAIGEVHRVLKPGGEAMIMVYSATSYRQIFSQPIKTLKRVFPNLLGKSAAIETDGSERARAAYDTNLEGDAAPQTEFVTKAELALLCSDFATCSIVSENIGSDLGLVTVPRPIALKFGRYFGLDLYCYLQK